MRFEQQERLVIYVSPGLHGKWDVAEKGFDQPLASFNGKEDAYAYAAALRSATPGATALVEDDDGFSPLPMQIDGQRNPDGASRPGDSTG